MSRILLFLIIVASLSGSIYIFTDKSQQAAAAPEHTVSAQQEQPVIPEEPKEHVTTYVVASGDTFSTVTDGLGMSYGDMLQMVEDVKETYDLTSIREGRPFRYVTSEDGSFVRLEYERDSEDIIVITKEQGTYVAQVEAIEYTKKTKAAKGKIASSFFNAGLEAGVKDTTIINVAEVLAWSIDFATQIQPGDSFEVLYEEKYRDGEYVRDGEVLAVKFVNSGKEYTAYRYVGADEVVRYYTKDGESLIKQFLRAPLEYKRISSGYSYARFHPTLQRTTTHLAIDYAAAMGTPIRAVGDGTVTVARYNGGYGNYIDIRHNSTYETQYAHLSAYAKGIKPGATVTQGQVIGYVGSTGFSTGPHLHYQIRKNGQLVNPLEVELPAGDPLPEEEKDAFAAVVDEYDSQLSE